ncbi:MAG: hypothetical protein ABR501_10895 [Pyrinomonadaceae bacterium]
MRSVRNSLERPDTITASAVSARQQISQAMADRIRETESASELKKMAEDVLPQIEKFLESPEEKRLRRVRAGIITASIGLGASVLVFMFSFAAHDLTPFIAIGLIAFLIGIGMVINGFAFTVPRKEITDRSEDADSLNELESRLKQFSGVNQVSDGSRSGITEPHRTDPIVARPSVTEHTTHQLKQNKS